MVTRVNGYNVSEVVGGVFFKIRDPDGGSIAIISAKSCVS